jgi:hypothetical protein
MSPPVGRLPAVRSKVSVENGSGKFRGVYHFNGTKPPVAGSYFSDNKDSAFAIVACSRMKTNQAPIRMSYKDVESLPCDNVPVMATWISNCGKFLVFPEEEYDFESVPMIDMLRRGWVLPKREWDEYFVVPAVKSKKYYYRNPCGWAEFMCSVKKLKPGKKCTDTESEAKKIRSEAFLQSQAAAILIPSKIKKQLNMPKLNPLKVPELNPLLSKVPDEPEKKQQQEKGKTVFFIYIYI